MAHWYPRVAKRTAKPTFTNLLLSDPPPPKRPKLEEETLTAWVQAAVTAALEAEHKRLQLYASIYVLKRY